MYAARGGADFVVVGVALVDTDGMNATTADGATVVASPRMAMDER